MIDGNGGGAFDVGCDKLIIFGTGVHTALERPVTGAPTGIRGTTARRHELRAVHRRNDRGFIVVTRTGDGAVEGNGVTAAEVLRRDIILRRVVIVIPPTVGRAAAGHGAWQIHIAGGDAFRKFAVRIAGQSIAIATDRADALTGRSGVYVDPSREQTTLNGKAAVLVDVALSADAADRLRRFSGSAVDPAGIDTVVDRIGVLCIAGFGVCVHIHSANDATHAM